MIRLNEIFITLKLFPITLLTMFVIKLFCELLSKLIFFIWFISRIWKQRNCYRSNDISDKICQASEKKLVLEKDQYWDPFYFCHLVLISVLFILNGASLENEFLFLLRNLMYVVWTSELVLINQNSTQLQSWEWSSSKLICVDLNQNDKQTTWQS